MIVYEVNLHIDAIAADEYAEWLGPHIEQILDIEGFQKAEFVLDHGFLDFISHRKDLKTKINLYLDLVLNRPIREISA